ncbi:helix-turn-helix transcriptional regulator [Paludisphaera sp.]|uniref:helix-turn-helix transcriptional regulator n=1 Tax=Paludisphaera sp. TaxID=2017432 RepID=UPI00301B9F7E
MSRKTRQPRAVAPDVRSIREGLGLPRKDFARFAGLSERTITSWEGRKAPPASRLQRLQRALARVVRPEAIGPWLGTPNPAFSGLKPLEVIERGEVDRLWRMIHEIESGMPT